MYQACVRTAAEALGERLKRRACSGVHQKGPDSVHLSASHTRGHCGEHLLFDSCVAVTLAVYVASCNPPHLLPSLFPRLPPASLPDAPPPPHSSLTRCPPPSRPSPCSSAPTIPPTRVRVPGMGGPLYQGHPLRHRGPPQGHARDRPQRGVQQPDAGERRVARQLRLRRRAQRRGPPRRHGRCAAAARPFQAALPRRPRRPRRPAASSLSTAAAARSPRARSRQRLRTRRRWWCEGAARWSLR